jgi:hypothetical protein
VLTSRSKSALYFNLAMIGCAKICKISSSLSSKQTCNLLYPWHTYIHIYIWKFKPAVSELDFVDNYFVLPTHDLNSHHWYTAAPIASLLRQIPYLLNNLVSQKWLQDQWTKLQKFELICIYIHQQPSLTQYYPRYMRYIYIFIYLHCNLLYPWHTYIHIYIWTFKPAVSELDFVDNYFVLLSHDRLY